MQEHKQRWWARPTEYNKFIPDKSHTRIRSDDLDIIPLRSAQSCKDGVLTMNEHNYPCCTTDVSCNPRMYQFDPVDSFTFIG